MPAEYFVHLHGCHEGGKGAQFPGDRITMETSLWRRRITAWGAEKSQQCHKYFLQYSTFASEKPDSNSVGGELLLAPGAIYNLITPLFIYNDSYKFSSQFEV